MALSRKESYPSSEMPRPSINRLTPHVITAMEQKYEEISYGIKRLRIAIIHSPDREEHTDTIRRGNLSRSFKSYKDTALHIGENLHQQGFPYISVIDDVSLKKKISKKYPDLAILNTAGIQGEDTFGFAANLCQSWGIPYAGHRP